MRTSYVPVPLPVQLQQRPLGSKQCVEVQYGAGTSGDGASIWHHVGHVVVDWGGCGSLTDHSGKRATRKQAAACRHSDSTRPHRCQKV